MSLYQIINFKDLSDDRGGLVAIESLKDIPFDIKRTYYIFGTKEGVERGFHAHKELKQVAICLKGSCNILFDNGREKETFFLDDPTVGITINPLIWHEMNSFTTDCILLVIASENYDENDYIRSYDDFKKLI